MAHRRGRYGFDAPYVPIILGLIGAGALALAGVFALAFRAFVWAGVSLVYSLFFLLSSATYVHTTRAGKFHVWADILARLELRGDERMLDMGCGRGAVLTMAAQYLTTGRAIGVDLWRSQDQSGNDAAATLRNAAYEGVADRVEVQTADMRALPFADASFDIVLSSLAIHNIAGQQARLKAIDEAVRVLKPGGKLRIADIQSAPAYARRLRQLGMRQVACRALGWRFWYGGPWVATTLVSAVKPN